MAEINWQGLEKFLSEGHSLDASCRLSRVDVADARVYLDTKKDLLTEDTSTNHLAHSCLVDALRVLRDLAVSSPDEKVKLGAAVELCNVYRHEKKRLEAVHEKSKQGGAYNPEEDCWSFKKVTA